MTNPTTFREFPKVARLSRECLISEKIDGTNTQVFVWDELHSLPAPEGEVTTSISPPPADVPWIWTDEGIHVAVGSRTKWITPTDDNHGFAKWALAHAAELVTLGHGRHYGEYWGSGINRGYGLPKGEKRLSLFNVARWCLHGQTPQRIPTADPRVEKWQDMLPPCVGLVPLLYRGIFTTDACEQAIAELRLFGSKASPGFAKPEGIVCWHTAANMGFKKTLEKDETPKSLIV